ncbi:MAG: rhodanese-like domain-containing protein [Clostridiales bacterium]|nr:rhodanese-like domain-containing protein [Clostridiales bacterium]
MKFQIIYPKQLDNLARRTDIVIVDIRSRSEYAKDHYPGAVNWTLEELADFEILFKKNLFYVLYCEHGGSSIWYARELGEKGYHVGSVLGGWESMCRK